MSKNYYIKFIYLFIFSIAFAFIESSVVIYIRQLFYPQGFEFPLTSGFSGFLLYIEIIREFSTIVVIFMSALISGKKLMDRFAYFIFIFAVWDIFYYIFLKLTINWPASLLTWDILFLIPFPWTGPVLYPVICSLTMIVMSFIFYYLFNKHDLQSLSKLESSLLAIGTFIIFISFVWDYLKIIIENINLILKGVNLGSLALNYKPSRFYWEIFIAGELVTISSIFIIIKRVYNNKKSTKKALEKY